MRIPGTFRKIWSLLRPPMSMKEAKMKGITYIILVVLFYLVRDVLLYVVLPLAACSSIFN
jgi:hypothetical protein